MVTERDYYDILGVPRGASDEEIKRAFRKLAQRWHPDVSTDAAADERFKEINQAYQVLADPQRRQAYDLFGRAGIDTGAGEGFGPFAGFGGFGDVFDAFFGGAAAGGGRRPRPPAGSDLRYDLRLTFAEAIAGADKQVEFAALSECETCAGSGAAPGSELATCPRCSGSGELRHVRSTMLGQMVSVSVCDACRGLGKVVQQPCPTCRGDGRMERTRKVQVKVPPGIDDGGQLRYSGQGEAAPRAGAPGNLYVVVHVEPHPQLVRRRDTELYFELPLSLTQAALGARVRVPTADGEETIEIKPGTQPGSEIRLRGRGVPHLRRAGARGDLHVLVDVRVPSRLTSRQRELLEQLAAEMGERDMVEVRPAERRRGRRAPRSGIRERLKDAIS
jgi:molecular chaperone DnaJ